MDRIEAMIWQHLYCTGIGNAVGKKVMNCDNLSHTKWLNKTYGKLPAKEAE